MCVHVTICHLTHKFYQRWTSNLDFCWARPALITPIYTGLKIRWPAVPMKLGLKESHVSNPPFEIWQSSWPSVATGPLPCPVAPQHRADEHPLTLTHMAIAHLTALTSKLFSMHMHAYVCIYVYEYVCLYVNVYVNETYTYMYRYM